MLAKLTRDFTAIIQKEAELFGGLPYNRYVFIIHAGRDLAAEPSISTPR
jgi:predicted metalloprotease with PDZ domain